MIAETESTNHTIVLCNSFDDTEQIFRDESLRTDEYSHFVRIKTRVAAKLAIVSTLYRCSSYSTIQNINVIPAYEISMNTGDTANVPVKSVERAIEVISVVQARNGATLSELADDLEVAKSTVHNHLLTLERRGYLVRDDGVFHIGLQFLDHGGFARERKASYRFVRPKLHEIAQETNELCQFVVGQHGEGFVLFQARGTDAVETQSRIGSHGPLHTVPGGKAILARFSGKAVNSFIEDRGLPTTTSRTITDPDELFRELERITERGYAVNRSEYIKGLDGIGVPIQSADGGVLGALTVLGPSHRLDDDSIEEEISDRLLDAANELELNVTYSRV